MIACLDAHYFPGGAHAAAVVLAEWNAETAASQYIEPCTEVGEYAPGSFYLRELPALLAVIGKIQEPIDTYVIDGYCHLAADLTPGLGARLWTALEGKAAIVGVAKSRFHGATHAVELLRPGSRQPLFITAIGMTAEEAAQRIRSMFGPFRIPTLLKEADRLSRLHPVQSLDKPSP